MSDDAALADARRLFEAWETGVGIAPLTESRPDMGLPEAYAVQRALITLHEEAGRRVAGHKIGLTSKAIQEQLGVDSPDFGVVLDACSYPSGATLPRGALHMLLPRLEAELAFVLDRPLSGPGVTRDDVLAATSSIVPCFEVIDSRIRDWKIKLPDTIADNASCWGVVAGEPVAPADVEDLSGVTMRLERNGEVLAEGRSDAVLGHPAEPVAWLANTLGELGGEVPAGTPVLSGSFSAAVDADPGTYTAVFSAPFASVSVTITA